MGVEQVAHRVRSRLHEGDGIDQHEQVHLNGVLVTEKVRLRGGDQIKIHDYIIRTEPDPMRPAKPPAQPVAKRTSVARMTRFVQYRLPPGTVLKKTDDNITIQPEQVSRVGQTNVVLGQRNTIEELMETGLETLLEAFGAQRAWMGVRRVNYGTMEYVEGRLATGHTADLPETGENLKPRVLDRSQFLLLPYGDDSCPVPIVAGPLVGPEGTLGMVFIDSGESERRYEIADLDFFILLSNTLAAQLDAIFKKIAKTREAMLAG